MSARALVQIALLALFLSAAAGAAACGDSSSADLGPYLGDWQRVDAGEPDPAFTLLVQRRDDAATAIFTETATGMQTSIQALPQDGYLASELPAGNAFVNGALGMQLSLDQDGQLVVDKVLDDGTTEPVWIYARPASAPSLTPAP